MSRLVKGMYSGLNIGAAGLFGLRGGQVERSDPWISRGRWFNEKGEFLGAGDLSGEQLQYISHELYDDELFVVLSENSGCMELVGEVRARKMGLTCQIANDHLPISYIAQYCDFIVESGCIMRVSEGRCPEDFIEPVMLHGELQYMSIGHGRAVELIERKCVREVTVSVDNNYYYYPGGNGQAFVVIERDNIEGDPEVASYIHNRLLYFKEHSRLFTAAFWVSIDPHSSIPARSRIVLHATPYGKGFNFRLVRLADPVPA